MIRRALAPLLCVSTLVLVACGPRDQTAGTAAAKTGRAAWLLELHDAGSEAKLDLPADQPTALRVRIARATVPTDYNIQLRRPGFNVAAGDSLTLSFRARADSARGIGFGIGMAHVPWTGLGFYRRLDAGPEWKGFSETFVLTTGDDNAQLTFDLGARAVSVELDSIVLRRHPSGQIITP